MTLKSPIVKFIGFIVFIVILGILGAGIFFVGFTAFILSTTKNEVVLHTLTSLDNSLIVSVIANDCGATCGCRVRVDLQEEGKIFKEIFRDEKSCDASIVWLDNKHFKVQPDSGNSAVIDVNALELEK